MVHYPNTYAPGLSGQTMDGRPLSRMDWSAEITPGPENQIRPASDTGMGGMAEMPGDLSAGMGGTPRSMMGGTAGTPGGMMNGMPGEMMNGTPGGMMGASGGMMARNGRMFPMNGEMSQQGGGLNMQRTGLPDEVIEAPTTVDEAYRGSLKAMLNRYIGSYVVATFLLGTQGTVAWEGTLFDVGNDFVTIYQEPRDRYIVSDLYSLKYIEFYDTKRRELCEALIQQNGWQNNG
ncbi:MAG: hypothetical protein Q4C45_03305 [Oscillospiraceae bacterium]|nr:hypothetical protein [Oscillospiraceae bacterium]